MKAEVIRTYENGKVTIQLDATPAIANVLRRAVFDLVPTMAIEDLELTKNSSIMYDEMIGHRVGLLPLTTDLKSYNLISECSCEGAGCSKCTLKLTLKAKGPETVHAEEIKSKDPKVKPVYPKTPITKLLKGQELEFEATAILGRGSQHAKFCPGLAWYSYKPKITITNEKLDAATLQKYPPQVVSNGKIDKKLIEEHNLVDAVDGISDAVTIEYDPTCMLLSVEPWGQLIAKEILLSAIDELQSLLKKFESAMEKPVEAQEQKE